MSTMSVILLDDDAFLLKALQRTIQRIYPSADVWAVSTVEELWQLLQDNPTVDLVISDYLMPQMLGLDVLEHCVTLNAYPVRALLTGDMSLVTMMRQPNIVHAYLAKPFNEHDVVSLFTMVTELNDLPFARQVRVQLGSMTAFPVCPAMLKQLQRMVQQDQVDLQQVAAVVAQEPVIVAKVLQLANSAYLGFQRKTASIHEAISRLGTQMLLAIVTSMALSEHVKNVLPAELHQRQLDIAANYALCVKRFAAHCGFASDQQVQLYAVAMLSFVGKVILLAEGRPEKSIGSDATLQQGIADYQLITAYVMKIWGHSAEICSLLLSQHELMAPLNEPIKRQNQLLYIAKQLFFNHQTPELLQTYCMDHAIAPELSKGIVDFDWQLFSHAV